MTDPAPKKPVPIPRKELEQEFCRIATELTYKSNPIYASTLMQCARVYTHEIPTLAVAVTQQVLLLINPDFFFGKLKVKDKKTGKEEEVGCKDTQQRLAVIEHEILHLIFYHLSRGQRHHDRERSNIAADVVCNQFVRWKLPGDPCTFEKYGLEKDKDMDTYYVALKKQQDDKGKVGDHNPGATGRGSHETWSDPGGEGDGEKENETLKRCGIDSGGLADSAKEAIVCDILRNAVNREGEAAMGKLPGSVANQLKEMIKEKKPTQPWNSILRRFVGTHGSSQLKQTIKHCSKRFRDPLTGFKVRPGLRVKRSKKILIGIDTSGSMGEDEFNLFAGEIRMISRYNKDITVAECDTEVHRSYPYRGKMDYVVGRGGTDMNPIKKMFVEGKYDLCICFTDGYIGEIGEKPRGGWLWIITHNGSEPCPWGSYVKLPNPSEIEEA